MITCRSPRGLAELVDAWAAVVPHVEEVLAHGDYTAADLRAMLTEGQAELVLIEDGDSMVGFGVNHVAVYPGGVAYLHDSHVWIFPGCRNRGAYSTYLAHLKGVALARGLRGVTLQVHAGEDEMWRSLLARKGFAPRAVTYCHKFEEEG